MKFNMGCGQRRLEGYVNVDSAKESAADEVWDLERTPWPWADGCAEEIRFIHALEHMGAEIKMVEERTIVDDAIWKQVEAGEISRAEIQRMVEREFNVATEFRIVLEARKPVS